MCAQRRAATVNKRSRGRGSQTRRDGSTAVMEVGGGGTAVATAPTVASSPAVAPERTRQRNGDVSVETEAPSRSKPAQPESQGRLAQRWGGVRRRYADTRAELKRVTWPDQETTQNLTLVVIAVSIVMGVLLGGIDYVLFQFFQSL